MTWRIDAGDARAVLAGWPAGSVQCVCTSPPYYLLRDYGTARWEGGDPACDHIERYATDVARSNRLGAIPGYRDHLPADNAAFKSQARQYRDACGKCGAERIDEQIGLESSLDAYIAALVDVFRAVRRVLRPDGTLWLNIGDSYSNAGRAGSRGTKRGAGKPGWTDGGALGDKQLLLVPARVALALQADGWVLRSEIIWHKVNPMPESVTDRPTKAHEQLFLFAQQGRYYYNADAIREPQAESTVERTQYPRTPTNKGRPVGKDRDDDGKVFASGLNALPNVMHPLGRNKRDVWSLASEPFPDAHFATMPTALVEPCILAGSRPGDIVADPFTGAGTVGVVALRHGRAFWGAELNESYCDMARARIVADAPLFNREGAA